jgi:hypothetical protein
VKHGGVVRVLIELASPGKRRLVALIASLRSERVAQPRVGHE